MRNFYNLLIFLFLAGGSVDLAAQFMRVDSIQFQGNEKTKKSILLRELDVIVGDSLGVEELDKRIEFNRRKLMNTNLFIWVKSDYHQLPNGHLSIKFEFLEQWYILAYPIFQFADLNFNDWWSRGHQMDRTVYGIHFIHTNFRGRNEKLVFKAETGFADRLDFSYFNPYIDKKKTLGLSLNTSYSTSKTIPYATIHDSLSFVRSDNNLREKWSGSIALKRRIWFYDFQTFELKYTHSVISDTISKLNPSYFLQGKTEQNYAQISYTYSYDFRDFTTYPLRGKKIDLGIYKFGLLPNDHVNFMELTSSVAYFFDLGSKFFLTSQVKAKISLGGQIPYANQRGLGYGNELVRGYELNVIDGTSYFLNRNTFKFQLINKIIKLPFLPMKQFNQVPIAIYPTAFLDLAYVQQSPNEFKNSLANRWLSGAGLGFDIVTYYNLVCKIGFPVTNGTKSGIVVGVGREF
ncbi:MAG: hypothetical protein RL246_1838 [Bacteroidota bacterium]